GWRGAAARSWRGCARGRRGCARRWRSPPGPVRRSGRWRRGTLATRGCCCRYQAEARTAFHPAYGQLVKALERDRAEAEAEAAVADTEPEAPAAESPSEPSRAVAAGPKPPPEPSEESAPSGSPNEPRTVGDWLVHLLAAEGVAAALVPAPEAPSAASEGA